MAATNLTATVGDATVNNSILNDNAVNITDDDADDSVDNNKGFITIGSKRSMQANDRDPRKFRRRVLDFAPITTNNKFSGLPVQDITEAPMDDGDNVIKDKLPPPIHISQVINYHHLITSLTNVAEGASFHCKSAIDKVIVYPSTPDLYRIFVKFLKDNGVFILPTNWLKKNRTG